MRDRMRKQKGVTLLELTIILALMILALGIPLFSFGLAMDTLKLNNTAKILKSNLRLFQDKAIVEGQYYEFRFDITMNRYRIYRGTKAIQTVNFPSGVHYLYVTIGSDVFLPVLRFYPTGSPSSGGTIALENNQKAKRYIVVTPAVGRVRISD